MSKTHQSVQEKLAKLASNYWWSWQPEVTTIFRELAANEASPEEQEFLRQSEKAVTSTAATEIKNPTDGPV